MILSYSSNKYRITFDGVSMVENALGNPNLVQVALTSGCTIQVAPDEVYGITYKANGEYAEWRLDGINTRLNRIDEHYIYARINRADDKGLIIFSVNRYRTDGKIFEKEAEMTSPTPEEPMLKGDYFYILIGKITSTDSLENPTVQREITLDGGYLTTPQGTGSMNDMFRIIAGNLIQPLKRMASHVVEGTLEIVSHAGARAKILLNGKEMSDIARNSDVQAKEPDDQTVPTTAYLKWKLPDLLSGKFIRKDKEDATRFLLRLLAGVELGEYAEGLKGAKVDANGDIITNKVASHAFTSGMLGSGFVIKKDADGRAYVETDDLLVRRRAMFAVLEILKQQYIKGDIIQGPGGGTCRGVEEFDTYYRCYLLADDGEKAVENTFDVDDQVRCQEFNIKPGVHENVSNQYYWRKCIAVGDDYIDLSKTDCDRGSMDPKAGDDMATMGNRTNPDRQNATVYGVYGNDAPYIKQYVGINSYDLTGKEKTVVSPNGNKFTGEFVIEATGQNISDAVREAVRASEEAKKRLSEIAKDGIITPYEKVLLKDEYNRIHKNYINNVTKAETFGVDTSSYMDSYSWADNYIVNIIQDMSVPTTIDPTEYDNIFADYYLAETDIIRAIDDKIKSDTDAAGSAAADAVAKATEAAKNAEGAKKLMDDLSNDSILTPYEKSVVKKEFDIIQKNANANMATADQYGIPTDDYQTQYAALSSYLTPLLAKMNEPSNVVPAVFNDRFGRYYDEEIKLLNAISVKAKQIADSANSSASTALNNANQALRDASTAKTNAENASADASAAKERLDNWAKDGLISPTEKTLIKDEIKRIDSDKSYVEKSVITYGMTTPQAYYNAHTNYRAELVKLSASTPENIQIPSTFANIQSTYYTQRAIAFDLIGKASVNYTNSKFEVTDKRITAEVQSVNESIDGVVRSTNSRLDIQDKQIGTAVAQVSQIGQQVENQATSIQQNADAIKLKAEQSSVDALGRDVEQNTADIALIPDQISLQVKAEVKKVTSGSNLLKNTALDVDKEPFYVGNDTTATIDKINKYNTRNSMKAVFRGGGDTRFVSWETYTSKGFHSPNRPYTCTFYARTDSQSLVLKTKLLFNTEVKQVTLTRDWQKFTIQYNPKDDAWDEWVMWTNSGGTIYINSPQIEEGATATAWGPAPDDVKFYTDAKIEIAENRIDQQVEEIRGIDERVTQNTSSIEQTSQTITSQVTRIEKVEGQVKTNTTWIEQSDETIALKVSEGVSAEMGKVEIGGRNLLIDTNRGNENWWFNTNGGKATITSEINRGVNSAKFEVTQMGSSWNLFVYKCNESYRMWKKGKKCVLSFDVYPSVSTTINAYISTAQSSENIASFKGVSIQANKWNHVVIKSLFGGEDAWYTNNKHLLMACGKIGTYIFQNLQLEEGTVATDWTPATQDIEKANENLVLNSDTAYTTLNSAKTYRLSRTWHSLRSKYVTISFDYEYKNLKTGSGTQRFGLELGIQTSGGISYGINCWVMLDSNAALADKKGRQSNLVKVPGNITDTGNNGIVAYIQVKGGSGDVTIKNVKIEEGHVATPWTPAPQDYPNDKKNLLATGIDIETKKITLTADKTWIVSNSGDPIAFFGTDSDGGIQFNSNVYVTYIKATKGTIGGFKITDNMITRGSGDSIMTLSSAGLNIGTREGSFYAGTGGIGFTGRPLFELDGGIISSFKMLVARTSDIKVIDLQSPRYNGFYVNGLPQGGVGSEIVIPMAKRSLSGYHFDIQRVKWGGKITLDMGGGFYDSGGGWIGSNPVIKDGKARTYKYDGHDWHEYFCSN